MPPVAWFYGKDNKQHGPATAAQLKQLAQSGKLKPTDLVWREGMDEWIAASKVKGLFDDDAPAPPKAPPDQPKPAASREAAEVFADSPAKERSARRGEPVHLFDLVLAYVRARFTDRFLEATSKLFTLCGHFGLYAAMVLVFGFGLMAGVKTNQLNTVLMGVAWAFGLAALQYAARRFFKALGGLSQSTSATLGSTAVPDCFALVAALVGAAALLGLAVAAVQTGVFALLLPAVAVFILCQYLAVVAVNQGSLNITIDPDARAGEEALGVFSFVIKVWLRLVPVAFGVGVVCGGLILLAACGMLFIVPAAEKADSLPAVSADVSASLGGFGEESPEAAGAVAAMSASSVASAARSGTWLVIGSAALPVVAYLLFVFAHLAIDVIRAVLALPGKLDVLRERQTES